MRSTGQHEYDKAQKKIATELVMRLNAIPIYSNQVSLMRNFLARRDKALIEKFAKDMAKLKMRIAELERDNEDMENQIIEEGEREE